MHPFDNTISQPMVARFSDVETTFASLLARTPRRLMIAFSVLAIAIVATVMFAAEPASAAGCRNADILPASKKDVKRAEAATRCLINKERRSHGMRSTKFNKRLHKSALWQAKDMLRHEYFDHDRSGGPSFVGRISRFGYGRKSNGYSLGENLAWAPESVATPREMVRMWMESPGHRRNILHRKFREQAVSAVLSDGDVGGDYEDSGGPFVVYVSQFGTRY